MYVGVSQFTCSSNRSLLAEWSATSIDSDISLNVFSFKLGNLSTKIIAWALNEYFKTDSHEADIYIELKLVNNARENDICSGAYLSNTSFCNDSAHVVYDFKQFCRERLGIGKTCRCKGNVPQSHRANGHYEFAHNILWTNSNHLHSVRHRFLIIFQFQIRQRSLVVQMSKDFMLDILIEAHFGALNCYWITFDSLLVVFEFTVNVATHHGHPSKSAVNLITRKM